MRSHHNYPKEIELLTKMMKNIGQVIFRYELLPEPGFSYASPSASKITGYTPEEHYANHELGYKIIHPNDLNKLRSNIKIFRNEPYELELRWIKKNGSIIWIEQHLTNIYDDSKNLIALEGVARDITNRKISELKLRESEKRFQTFSDATFEAIFLSENGICTGQNQTAERLFGYTHDEALGKPGIDWIAPKDWDLVLQNMKSGHRKPYVVTALRKDGTIFPAEIQGTMMEYDGHQVRITALRDISDKAEDLKALHESEANLSAVLESINESVWSIDLDYRILTLNSQFKKEFLNFYGVELKKGMRILDIIQGEEKEKWMLRYKKTLSGDSIQEVDQFNFPDEIKYFEIRLNPIWDHKTIIGATVITRDITDRKKNEAKIRQNEEKFRMAFKTSPDSVTISRLDDGKYISVNNGFTRIMGYSEDEVLGKNAMESNIWNTPTAHEKMTDALSKSGVIINQEAQFKTKNGLLKDGLLSASTINLDGVPHIISITRDITERKRAEKIQHVLYEISRLSYKKLDLPIFLEKVHHHVNTIIHAHNFYVALYHKKDDAYTFPYFKDETETFDTPKAIRLDGSLTDLVRRKGKGEIITQEYEDRIKETEPLELMGSPSLVWLGAPLLTAMSNEVFGVIAVQDYHNVEAYTQKDLTILEIIAYNIGVFIERIQNLDALQNAKEKAEESDRLKSAFLANMSHEIRTPMNGILGFADLLKEPDLSGDEQIEYVNIIEKSGERMLNIINDLIDISKIEAGQMEVVISDTDIREQAEYLCTFFKPEMERKRLQFIINFPTNSPTIPFKTDREKVYAIITNLLKNAIKYTDKGSIEFGYALKKSSEPVGIEQGRSTEVEFYIKDTGSGIPENRIDAIFERFIQADIEDKKAKEGAGLGLAITKAYLEMLGGKIWVESEESVGSTFYFTIPDQTQAEPIPKSEKTKTELKEETKTRQLKILIAEDDETSKMHLSILLKNFAKEIVYAHTGAQSVELCRHNPDIDLIMMDIKLPKMDGYTATRKIREFNKDVVIIAQTAYALAGDREKALEAGCNDYITKPISKATLRKTIIKHIQRV